MSKIQKKTIVNTLDGNFSVLKESDDIYMSKQQSIKELESIINKIEKSHISKEIKDIDDKIHTLKYHQAIMENSDNICAISGRLGEIKSEIMTAQKRLKSLYDIMKMIDKDKDFDYEFGSDA